MAIGAGGATAGGTSHERSNTVNEAEGKQNKVREFMSLLPLTLELAGLPKSESGRYYTPEQIEVRLITLRHAYRLARQFAVEVASQP